MHGWVWLSPRRFLVWWGGREEAQAAQAHGLRNKRAVVLPLFRAAGLIVPEPSLISARPFNAFEV